MRFGKLVSWVGNKLVFDFLHTNVVATSFFKEFIGTPTFVLSRANKEKKIGKIYDVIGNVNNPKIVVAISPNITKKERMNLDFSRNNVYSKETTRRRRKK